VVQQHVQPRRHGSLTQFFSWLHQLSMFECQYSHPPCALLLLLLLLVVLVPQGVLPLTGWRDLPGFISAAADQGLLVLLRPGPYICAGGGTRVQVGGGGE
jgi:hypothetical protein